LLFKVTHSPADSLSSRAVDDMSVPCKALAATVSQSRVCDGWKAYLADGPLISIRMLLMVTTIVTELISFIALPATLSSTCMSMQTPLQDIHCFAPSSPDMIPSRLIPPSPLWSAMPSAPGSLVSFSSLYNGYKSPSFLRATILTVHALFPKHPPSLPILHYALLRFFARRALPRCSYSCFSVTRLKLKG